jgi:hypothetical protein
MNRKEYYLSLLEGRTTRLNELLTIAAPDELICKEILLIVQAAIPLNPEIFKSFLRREESSRVAIG